MTGDEMVRWHHWLNGHEFGWTLGVGDGQGGLACCGSWGRKELDMTDWLNWTEKKEITQNTQICTCWPSYCTPDQFYFLGLQNIYRQWLQPQNEKILLLGRKVMTNLVQFSCPVMSDSLQPHELQHTRPPCPSPTPGVHPNPCPLSRWCHPTTSHPLSSPSPPALSLSQHQGLFKWVSSSH